MCTHFRVPLGTTHTEFFSEKKVQIREKGANGMMGCLKRFLKGWLQKKREKNVSEIQSELKA